MRTRPPALRTLPSSTWLTLSSRATFGTSTCLPLNMKALLRETTDSAETLLRSVMMSSVMPSLKYSCSGSPLMLAKGSTQMATCVATCVATRAGALADAAGAASGSGGGATSRLIVARRARSTSWASGLSGSSPQSSKSVVCSARTSIGRTTRSKRTGTKMPRSAPSRASPRTQRDATDTGVQTTRTAAAAFSSAAIWRSNSWPALISGSHHTDQPCASMTATSGATRALSLRA